MAASRIEVVILHCDQGMGTLIEIYDKNNKLSNIALFDLGSESGTRKYSTDALNEVTEALKKMDSAGFKPTIDLLVISHQDYDHWSLLPDLLARMQAAGFPKCAIGDIFYGGMGWKKKANATIATYENAFRITAEPFGKAESDYTAKLGTAQNFYYIDDVKFHLLCANVPTAKAQDLFRNGTSAVIAVQFAGLYVIIPGDATADTIGWINQKIFDPWTKKGYTPVQPCRVLGAPHHGALRTIADNFVSTTRAQLTIATAFSNYVKAQNVVASAGYESKFKHPYKSVMELLGKNAVTDMDKHDWVWYDGTTKEWERTTKSTRGIWSTVTTLDDPPNRATWSFEIKSTGETTFFLNWRHAGVTPPRGRRRERYAAVPRKR